MSHTIWGYFIGMDQTKMAWRLCILCVSGWIGASWVGENEVRAEEVEKPVPWSQGFETVAESRS